MDEDNLLRLDKVAFFDAGPRGLAITMSTQPSQKRGKPYHFACLVNEERGKKLMREVASALALKFPGQIIFK